MNNPSVPAKQLIALVDYGSQYTPLIARRLRELGVLVVSLIPTLASAALKRYHTEKTLAGVILSGSPDSVSDEKCASLPDVLPTLSCPVLGICYGMQLMVKHFGGKVARKNRSEYGKTAFFPIEKSDLWPIPFQAAQSQSSHLTVWMSHGDSATQLPDNFTLIGTSQSESIAAIEDKKRKWYGLQFHPEVTHSEAGAQLFSQFLFSICQIKPEQSFTQMEPSLSDEVKQRVGDQESVLLALSGGVDSSVLAVLLSRILKDRLICVFVDTGLVRQEDQYIIREILPKTLGMTPIILEEQNTFLERLTGQCDPEEKRKIIGQTFIEVFARYAKTLEKTYPKLNWLAQGTIYPDVIESAAHSAQAYVIKSHHNVGALPNVLPFKLLEPLRTLFKDEVRLLGKQLGMDPLILDRHPFPGPGLSVRIMGEVNAEALRMVRASDAIFIEVLRQAGWYEKVSQALAIFLPIQTVGVKGDERAYEFVVALRAIETKDFMTARAVNLPFELLERVSKRILDEVAGVTRVVYDLSNKPPATIEWE